MNGFSWSSFRAPKSPRPFPVVAHPLPSSGCVLCACAARQAAPYYYCKNNFTYENGGESGSCGTCGGSPEPALSERRALEPWRDATAAAAAAPATHRPQSGARTGRCRLLRDAQHQRKKTARIPRAQLRFDRYYTSRWVPQMWANLPPCSTDPLLAILVLRGQQKDTYTEERGCLFGAFAWCVNGCLCVRYNSQCTWCLYKGKPLVSRFISRVYRGDEQIDLALETGWLWHWCL